MPALVETRPETEATRGDIWAFPGQGIQSPGLGAWLMDTSPAGSQVYKNIDKITGQPISEISRNGSREVLAQTEITQIVVFAYCLALLADWQSRRKEGFIKPPIYAVGHSLGEVTLLPALGILDLEPGTKLVARRGKAMGKVEGTGLVATTEELTPKQQEYLLNGLDLKVALVNTSQQTVYGGKFDQLNEALTRLGSRLKRINVSAAFHTIYMLDARKEFEEALAEAPFRDSPVPFIANTTGRLIQTKDEIIEELSRQVTEPVRFLDAIKFIGDAKNVDTTHEVSEKGIVLQMIESELGGNIIKTAAAATVAGAAGAAIGAFIWHKHHQGQ